MDWNGLIEFAKTVGLPGVMFVGLCVVVFKLGIRSIDAWERTQGERTKVEDKKADAMSTALTSLSGKVDAHHTLDIQSHAELSNGIAGLDSKLDTALGLTPVRGVPKVSGERRPARGGFHDGEDDR